MGKYRLLVLASHPIQYRTPLYRFLSKQSWLDLEVWYGDTYGVIPRKSRWGVNDFTWDGDQLSGYRSRFLKNINPRPNPSTFLGRINPEIIRGIRRYKPDAVWISGYNTLHGWFCFLSSWRNDIPILYSSDSNFLTEAKGLKKFIKRRIIGKLYKSIGAFLVSGTTNENHYKLYNVPQSKCFFVPWAVDNDYFQQKSDIARGVRQELRKKWGIPERDDVLLFVGRLVNTKRPQDLIHVATLLQDSYVVFSGSGPLENELKTLAEKYIPGRCIFLGFQNQARLPEIYATADLLVLPSSFEPWGLVVNECLAAGTPVVASRSVGAAYDLVPEEMRFEPRNIQDICSAVTFWRRLRRQHCNMTEWARNKVSAFSFQEDARGFFRALTHVSSNSNLLEGNSLK